MNNRGDFGIGTLTIFIAMVIVGAIAAGVLIQTSNTVQQQALATGEESEKQLVTMLRILEIAGTDGSDGTVENLSVSARLAGGSNPVKFEDALVQFDTDTFTAYYNYQSPLNSSTYCVINNVSYSAASCMNVPQNGASGTYTVEYLNRGRKPYDGAATDGDVVRIYIATTTTISGGDYYRFYVIPSHGTIDLVEAHAPDVIRESIAQIYP